MKTNLLQYQGWCGFLPLSFCFSLISYFFFISKPWQASLLFLVSSAPDSPGCLAYEITSLLVLNLLRAVHMTQFIAQKTETTQDRQGKRKMWASVWDFSLIGLKTFQYSYRDIQLLVHEDYQMEKVLREATYKCSMVPYCCLQIKHYLITAQGNRGIWYS